MNLLKQIQTIKYYVLRVDLSEPGIYSVRGVVFGRTGDQLDIFEEVEEQGLDEVLALIPKHSRILLLLTGNQVLSRFSEDQSLNLFEEIDEEDFYIQNSQSQEGWQMQAACRKSVVDPLIGLLTESRHFLVDISLGPVSIPEMEGLLEKAVLVSCHLRFEFSDQKLVLIDETLQEKHPVSYEEELRISGMNFSYGNVTLLAALLYFFHSGPAKMGALAENVSESRFFHLFQRAAVLILAVFFAVLLTNFLFYSKIQTKLDGMKTSGEKLTDQIEQIEYLKAQIQEYRNLTTQKALRSQETYSYYLDEMARIRPSGVWYNKLSIYPLSKKQELNKALVLDLASLLLHGETKDPVSLNKLINSLEEMHWVQDIELKNYESLSDKPGAEFELAVKKEE